MNLLLGIQTTLARCPSQSLIFLQENLLEELNQILNLEEDLWAIKSRTNWMIMGERNTFYFHISTLARRSSNRIHGLKDYVGNWIFYLNAIKSSLVEG